MDGNLMVKQQFLCAMCIKPNAGILAPIERFTDSLVWMRCNVCGDVVIRAADAGVNADESAANADRGENTDRDGDGGLIESCWRLAAPSGHQEHDDDNVTLLGEHAFRWN
jgi:hypothetical protein